MCTGDVPNAHNNTHCKQHPYKTHPQAAQTIVHLVLNSTLPAVSLPPTVASPSPPPAPQNQYQFLHNNHLQFQWGPHTYAWGCVHADNSSVKSGGCFKGSLRPYLYRCVELQTGRWVAAAVPMRAFRKLGYLDIHDRALQHILVATGFKVLDMGMPK